LDELLLLELDLLELLLELELFFDPPDDLVGMALSLPARTTAERKQRFQRGSARGTPSVVVRLLFSWNKSDTKSRTGGLGRR
jgi:hypothetical protein